MDDMLKTLLEIVNDAIDGDDIASISVDDKITDLWGSLEHVHLVYLLESHYKIEFNMNQIANMHTIGDILGAINECLENK